MILGLTNKLRKGGKLMTWKWGGWEDNGRVRKGGRNLGRSARTGGVKDEYLAMAEGQNVKY